MRFIILSCLLLLTFIDVHAQEPTTMPDDLPEPILVDERLGDVDPSQIVWLNVINGVIAVQLDPPNSPNSEVYRYHMDNGYSTLTTGLFQLELPSELQGTFQVGEDQVIYQSPFSTTSDSADVPRRILYFSNLSVVCGIECDSTLLMAGKFNYDRTEQNEFWHNIYTPIMLRHNGDLTVHWSSRHAVLNVAPYLCCNRALHRLNIYTYETTFITEEIYNGDRILAISEDGNRVTFTTLRRSEVNNALQRTIAIWTAPYHDEVCSCTYDASIQYITPEIVNPERDLHFAGALLNKYLQDIQV